MVNFAAKKSQLCYVRMFNCKLHFNEWKDRITQEVSAATHSNLENPVPNVELNRPGRGRGRGAAVRSCDLPVNKSGRPDVRECGPWKSWEQSASLHVLPDDTSMENKLALLFPNK